MAQLLLVDCELLEQAAESSGGRGCQMQRERLEALIPYSHNHWRLLLLSEQPEQWRPTRRTVDEDLVLQQQVHEQLMRWGADLDGFIYLPSPVFGRRRMRSRCLSSIIRRYSFGGNQVWLISARAQYVEMGLMAGLHGVQVGTAEKPVRPALQAEDFFAALKLLPRA